MRQEARPGELQRQQPFPGAGAGGGEAARGAEEGDEEGDRAGAVGAHGERVGHGEALHQRRGRADVVQGVGAGDGRRVLRASGGHRAGRLPGPPPRRRQENLGSQGSA